MTETPSAAPEWLDEWLTAAHRELESAFGVINPARIVDLHGEFWIQILNRGSSPETVGRIQSTLNVLTTDGRNLDIGSMPTQE